jgi:phytoene desaturase
MSTQAKALARRSENLNKDAPIALVIGSGFGGLAAAVRLAAKGWRVLSSIVVLG